MARLLHAIHSEVISNTQGKEVLEILWHTPEDPMSIIDKSNMRQITDPATIREWIKNVIDAHPTQVAQYHAGQEKLLGFFVGQLMKHSSGRVHPGLAQTLMQEALHLCR